MSSTSDDEQNAPTADVDDAVEQEHGDSHSPHQQQDHDNESEENFAEEAEGEGEEEEELGGDGDLTAAGTAAQEEQQEYDEEQFTHDVDQEEEQQEEEQGAEEEEQEEEESSTVDHAAADGGELASPVFAKVTYEYTAQKSDELSMKEGDIIIVTKKPAEGGWWFGQLATESGWFPMDFVTHIDEEQVKQFIMKQQQTTVRKATLSSSTNNAGSEAAGSGPGTPTMSKQAAMAEMAVLQQELKDLESKRSHLQQEIHKDREQRTKYIRLAKSELASSVLPLPNGIYTPAAPIDGPASAATLSFSCDVFARDLLRCCGRLSASIDADAHIQAELAPNLMEALTQLPPELQTTLKDDKWGDRLLDSLRNVTNPLMNLTANTDHVPYSTVHDLFIVLSQQLSAASKPPSAPPAAAPPPPPATKPSLPLSEVDSTASSEDSPRRTRTSSSSSKKKSKKDKAGKDKDKEKEKSKDKKKSAVS
eukprot:TRINITY_DN3777_c0_g1_i1.p1 TRINITY_DN3777_c0_g1~~TRINITY_DN3777_c0_g1_i1.p1  ORF type:complete len:477 (-),score=132.32 TRINITY_DN3777_c0_g1_i1:66-1496(-)